MLPQNPQPLLQHRLKLLIAVQKLYHTGSGFYALYIPAHFLLFRNASLALQFRIQTVHFIFVENHTGISQIIQYLRKFSLLAVGTVK